MRKGTLLAGLGFAGLGMVLFDEARRRQASGRGPATGLLPDSRPGTALITGGSSGIGATFARHLAGQGYNLVLVARRNERLAALAAELGAQYGVSVETLAADLGQPSDIERVANRIGELETLTLLVNNAGFGTTGRFARIDPSRHHEMVNVHVLASTLLARAALPGMLSRRRGGIINVASLGAFIPLPGGVNYSATKAYLVMFSEGLDNECRNRGVYIQALCPGFTHTEFHGTSEFRESDRAAIPAFLWTDADAVVDASLAALALGQPVCIPGWKNRVMIALARTMPASTLMRFALRHNPALRRTTGRPKEGGNHA